MEQGCCCLRCGRFGGGFGVIGAGSVAIWGFDSYGGGDAVEGGDDGGFGRGDFGMRVWRICLLFQISTGVFIVHCWWPRRILSSVRPKASIPKSNSNVRGVIATERGPGDEKA